METEDKDWDDYWNRNETLYGKICSFCRNSFISSSLAKQFDKYFRKSGYFLECGSGSSESSTKINKFNQRKLIAFDISHLALKQSQRIKNVDFFVNGDMFKLPFLDNSIDGIWNLGVMEHFDAVQLVEVLNEMHRVLKPGSHAIFFWARYYGSSGIALRAYSYLMKSILRRKFWYTPDEILPFKSNKVIRDIFSKSKMQLVSSKPAYQTLLIHQLVICKKAEI